LLLCTLGASLPCHALESWGGSVGLTSDYLVRGISRSNHSAAVQADLHISTASGLIGGLFASSVQIAPGEDRNAEVGAFVGFSLDRRSDWRARILASHYSYVGNQAGSKYDYDELTVEAGYREWLDVTVVYSPNSPRYLTYAGLIGVDATTAEFSVHSPWYRRLAATAGMGYSKIAGPEGAGYTYWSAGAVCDLAPWSISLSYVDTSTAAKYLFYDAAAHDRWMATLIWRF
jgi:uncharacterized protein (TIGR02001 family)